MVNVPSALVFFWLTTLVSWLTPRYPGVRAQWRRTDPPRCRSRRPSAFVQTRLPSKPTVQRGAISCSTSWSNWS